MEFGLSFLVLLVGAFVTLAIFGAAERVKGARRAREREAGKVLPFEKWRGSE